MSGDLIGPMEARLLELERRQEQLDRSLRAIGRDAVALGQGVWDAWSDFRLPPKTAPAPGVGGTIPGCTSALAATLYARDPVFGSVALQWDGTLMWTACKTVDYPGYGLSCARVSQVAVHYDLMKTGIFRMRWASNAATTTQCPIASDCSTATNCIAQQSNPIQIDSCVPFRAHMTVGLGGGFVILGLAINSGVRIDFSDSPF